MTATTGGAASHDDRDNEGASNNNKTGKSTIRVLALHGSEGNGDSFKEYVLGDWKRYLARRESIELDAVTLTAPFQKGRGYAWWIMPPGVRSFTATDYPGFDESSKMVLDAMAGADAAGSNDGGGEAGKCAPAFDLVVGHSQGAILVAALLALNKIQSHPRVGYVLNGAAWPNPYTSDLEALRFVPSSASPPPGEDLPAPRVLMVVGENDEMNPPEQADRVETALSKAGYRVSRVSHPGGHSVPVAAGPSADSGTVQSIAEWIVDSR